MFKISKIGVIKKIFKYSLFTLFIAFLYILLFGFYWTFSYEYINNKVQENFGSKLHIKSNYLVIEDPYIQYAGDKQFKVSAHIHLDHILMSFNTNLEIIGNISYDDGQIILNSQKINIDNPEIKKMLNSSIPKEYPIYTIPLEYSWVKKLLNKFLEKVSNNENGIKLTFRLI